MSNRDEIQGCPAWFWDEEILLRGMAATRISFVYDFKFDL